MPNTEIDYCEYANDAAAQAAYVTNAATILMGNDNTNTTADGANFFVICKFTASYTGYVTSLRSRGTANGNIKIALYADNAGSPGAWKVSGNATAVTANVTISVPITPTYIVAGTDYWIGFNTDVNAVNCRNNTSSTGTLLYKASTYSTFTFPDPAGTGFTSETYLANLAAYGVYLESFSEGTIKNQGSYSLKGLATQTDSLNKTLTKTF